MRSVGVKWEGPLPLDRVLRLNNRIEDFGLYQIYGLLHHPNYREQYQANLKRDLPRLP